GAICSIAFGQAAPILDGNVARVLSRVFMIGGSPKETGTQKILWALSADLVQGSKDCSALNQGLMEMGALLCLPRAPLCASCPLKRGCLAKCEGRIDEFPGRAEPPKMRKREFVALVICRRGNVLIRKRADDVVNGGLWEFP